MNQSRAKSRGLALIMVLVVLAMVSVMGLALLSEASTRNMAANNLSDAARARILAESGVNLALYYLNHPGRAPQPGAGGYWAGGQGLTLGASVPGTVDIVVSVSTDKSRFIITSTGRAGSSGSGMTHTIAASAAAPAVITARSADLTGNASVQGRVLTWCQAAGVTPSVPSTDHVNNYSTYWFNGQMGSARDLPTCGNVVGPTSDNPAGVFRVTSEINRNLTVNGTLIGQCEIRVTDVALTVTPQAGFPAMVLKGDLKLKHTNPYTTPSITLNGLAWLQHQVVVENCGAASLTVKGTVLCPGDLIVDDALKSLTIKADVTRTQVPDLDTTDQASWAAQTASWQDQ